MATNCRLMGRVQLDYLRSERDGGIGGGLLHGNDLYSGAIGLGPDSRSRH